MTYCLAIRVDEGLIFASDSRTNAGADHVSTFSKMHTFEQPGERVMCLLSAGNLATTQAVLRNIRRDNERGKGPRLDSVRDLAEAAEYVGQLSRNEQRKHGGEGQPKEGFSPEATFILGGQIKGRQHQIYLVYPEGNYISATLQTPYLQIGELKYGKPILDRIVREGISLEVAARCALVSMDSTMRSNATVGPPVELLRDTYAPLAIPTKPGEESYNFTYRAWELRWSAAKGGKLIDYGEVLYVEEPSYYISWRMGFHHGHGRPAGERRE